MVYLRRCGTREALSTTYLPFLIAMRQFNGGTGTIFNTPFEPTEDIIRVAQGDDSALFTGGCACISASIRVTHSSWDGHLVVVVLQVVNATPAFQRA